MSGNPKFLIGEKDGIEFGGNVEYVPESQDILYIAGDTETVKDKLDEMAGETSPKLIAIKLISGTSDFYQASQLIDNTPCFLYRKVQ